jgi:hypothetical protein
MKVMRTLLTFVLGCLAVFAPGESVFAQGYIVPNGVTYAGYSPSLGAEIHVLQNPTNGNFTGFALPPQGGNTFLFNPIVDEGVRTFLVSLNDPVSLPAIAANTYTELLFPNTYFFANGSTFYLGFYTGPRWTFPQTNPLTYDDPLFGWGRFRNNGGVIQMLDSALTYGAQGIYAGTQNFVAPEPSAASLCLLGALVGLLRPNRKR